MTAGQESSALHGEHHILAPVKIPQLGCPDPSSQEHRLSGFHHWPLDLPGADPQYGQAEDIAMGSGTLVGLKEDIALDSKPLAEFV
ncbi:hypothetical protein H920_04553 [Fukomys damarensis]|uniref:Uncharacterized protein n=1 Tax=Fukomys damarensis TaxID=885580 RepID=A0A091DPJ4_FUKDA|nr:hypothetical protein H920_04553 [Fukomys damarensis]